MSLLLGFEITKRVWEAVLTATLIHYTTASIDKALKPKEVKKDE